MGNPSAAGAATPGAEAAERLRTMIVTAQSLGLQTPGHHAHLVGRHLVDGDGRLRVELPADSCMARHLAEAGEVVATIEITDLAPTPVRDRVRARGRLTGWLTPTGDDRPDPSELAAVLDLATAELITMVGTTAVEPEEFVAARPDPLAADEAELLCHLHDHHPQSVILLRRLVPAAHLAGVREVRPVRLDRLGIVLRLEYDTRHDRDVRLAFSSPVPRPDQLAPRIRALLAEAGRCRAHQRS